MNPDTFNLPPSLREKVKKFLQLAEKGDFADLREQAKEISDELEQVEGNQGHPAFEFLKASIRFVQMMGEVEQLLLEPEKGKGNGDPLRDSGT